MEIFLGDNKKIKTRRVFLKLQSFKCKGCTVVSATGAQVEVGDYKALNSAFIYIAFYPKWTSCSGLHIRICNFKVELSGKARAIKVN